MEKKSLQKLNFYRLTPRKHERDTLTTTGYRFRNDKIYYRIDKGRKWPMKIPRIMDWEKNIIMQKVVKYTII